MPDLPVTSVVDNLILLDLAEFGNTFRRFLAVAKSRVRRHEFDRPAYVIGQGRFVFAPREGILPVFVASSASSSLSRAPTRLTLPPTETDQPATADPR
jgi:hypothetical protein